MVMHMMTEVLKSGVRFGTHSNGKSFIDKIKHTIKLYYIQTRRFITMSYIEIIKFKEDKTHELAGEVQNSSRHHCVIWDYFAKKYLGLEYFNVHSDCVEQQKLWNLFEDERLTMNERIILGSTYDYVLVKKEDIPLVVDAFKSFENESNLLEEADILSSLLNDEACVAIGWQSSITNMWDNYDIFNEKKHWSLLDEINAIEKVINDERDVEYDA